MRNIFPLLITSLALIPWPTANAQSIDPGFAPPSIYAPGTVLSALEQPDGKRVVTGFFTRANGVTVPNLSRFNPDGSLDSAFQRRLGYNYAGLRTCLLNNGQLMLATHGTLFAGGISRQGLLRLNTDGSADPTFDTGLGPRQLNGAPGNMLMVLPLPNGKIIAIGEFDDFNGTSNAGIVRLTATGAVDASFNSSNIFFGTSDRVNTVVALPNGQLIIGGGLTSYNGSACNGIARLNADGTLDNTFVQPLGTSYGARSEVSNMILQPDGKILIAGTLYYGGAVNGHALGRLLPTGAIDNSFSPPATLVGRHVYSEADNSMQLQADGKILFISSPGTALAGVPRLARLNPNGTVDASFQVGAGPNVLPLTLTLLASGKVMVGGAFTNFSGFRDRTLVQVTSSGAVDPTFQPLLQVSGVVQEVLLQPNGQVVAAGNFSEVNGQAARRLARFNTDGTLDAQFSANVDLDNRLSDAALQPDGRFLVASAEAVQRLLPTGIADNSFSAPNFAGSAVSRLCLQADGRVIVGGSFIAINNGVVRPSLLRLLADGSRDVSFAPASSGAGSLSSFYSLALQPNGKLLVGGIYSGPATGSPTRTVMRLESTGSIDPSFIGAAASSTAYFATIAVQPDGKVLVGGQFTTFGGATRSNVARLNTDGTLDVGFVPPVVTGTVKKLVLQSNSRLLVGGTFTGTGVPANMARLLLTGQTDVSFGATAVPNGAVNALRVQPDGNIIVGGAFAFLSNQPSMALARLGASSVLHVAAPAAVAARTEAWPVPAHTILNVVPDYSAHPQTLDLLDALGRPVRHQVLAGAGPKAEISVEGLAAGLYLLRVGYAEGSVVRRVQVQ